MSTPEWINPKPANPLTGDERFPGTGVDVLEFWRWAFSDLRENIVRGVLAEFLVAKAVGDPSPLRHAWDNYLVTGPVGLRQIRLTARKTSGVLIRVGPIRAPKGWWGSLRRAT